MSQEKGMHRFGTSGRKMFKGDIWRMTDPTNSIKALKAIKTDFQFEKKQTG